jgi:hypothetical protein
MRFIYCTMLTAVIFCNSVDAKPKVYKPAVSAAAASVTPIIQVPKGVCGWVAVVDPQSGQRWTQQVGGEFVGLISNPQFRVNFKEMAGGSGVFVSVQPQIDSSAISEKKAWKYTIDFDIDENMTQRPFNRNGKIVFNPKLFQFVSVLLPDTAFVVQTAPTIEWRLTLKYQNKSPEYSDLAI